MRERAALVGGSVDAAPDPDGGWTVRAILPLTPIDPDGAAS
jgi:signal transduction histidine kinase